MLMTRVTDVEEVPQHVVGGGGVVLVACVGIKVSGRSACFTPGWWKQPWATACQTSAAGLQLPRSRKQVLDLTRWDLKLHPLTPRRRR